MEPIFDQSRIAQFRLRAVRQLQPKSDFLAEIVAQDLAERLASVERTFEEAVELHGATGNTARHVLQTGKIRHLKRVEADPAFRFGDDAMVFADIETVPVPAGSANLILSPLAAHLTNDTPGLFIQIKRALMPDGLFLAAIPGSGTLQELRESLFAAEDELTGGVSPRVIPFADVRDIGALLQRAGFALPVVDVETYTVRYDSLFPLMRDLRSMGMSNPLATRSKRPATRKLFLRAAEIYAERFSDPDGRIRATFAIIYASGWAPHESQQKPLKPGSAKTRLADALRVKEEKL
jgi:SAM-dependent methyltransferase